MRHVFFTAHRARNCSGTCRAEELCRRRASIPYGFSNNILFFFPFFFFSPKRRGNARPWSKPLDVSFLISVTGPSATRFAYRSQHRGTRETSYGDKKDEYVFFNKQIIELLRTKSASHFQGESIVPRSKTFFLSIYLKLFFMK